MLALILCIIGTVAFAVITYACYKRPYSSSILEIASLIISILAGAVSTSIIAIAIMVNVCAAGTLASKQQEYDSLRYQLEHHLYDNDNDMGKKELYSQITDWNADMAYGKEMQDNLWIGICFPNIYDELEFIKLPIITYGEAK